MAGRGPILYQQQHSVGRHDYDTYDTIDGYREERRLSHQSHGSQSHSGRYGTFQGQHSLERSRDYMGEGGYLDGTVWKSSDQTFRNKPVLLSDKTRTKVRHKLGNYGLAVVILFIITFPFGICFVLLLPFLKTKHTKWMKDTEHTDTISGHIVGVYRRGKKDAPHAVSFYREPDNPKENDEEIEEDSFDSSPNHRLTGSGSGRRGSRRNGNRRTRSSRHSSRESSVRFQDEDITISNEPIKLHIVFSDTPVNLPDGEKTVTKKRIGMCNLIAAYVTYVLGCILFPFPLLCFVMPCFKDVEHVHPKTKQIVGVNYKCV